MRTSHTVALILSALTFTSAASAQFGLPAKGNPALEKKANDAMAASQYDTAGQAYEELYDTSDNLVHLKLAAQAYMKMGPKGKRDAVRVLQRYIRKAKKVEEAREGSALLAQAMAIPDEAAPKPAAPPPPPPPKVEPKPEPKPAPAPPPPAAKEPVPEKAPAETEKKNEQSDHVAMVKRFSLGWFGVSNIPLPVATPGGTNDNPAINWNGTKESLAAPALGARYWFNEGLGLDVALGLHYSTGSIANGTNSIDKQSRFGIMFHGGVPISPHHGDHYAIIIVPEFNLGIASSSVAPPPGTASAPPDASLLGVRFDAGARAGMEVHFGFMGVPQLSLEATVGAYLTAQTVGASSGNAEVGESDIALTTASYSSPWDIFTNNVAARYYF